MTDVKTAAYQPLRDSRSLFLPLRQQRYHLRMWGRPEDVTPERPALWLMHGWMDCGASYQFLVDELERLDGKDGEEGPQRCILAPDWRGFGLSEGAAVDSYWFADYLGDLDALLRHPELGLADRGPVDLVGHSMGGNVVMLYAGVRPQRIRRLVNLEGFGMPRSEPEQAPQRYAQWLDEIASPASLKPYPDLAAVADRLRRNNPRLRPDRADWLAAHWARQTGPGQWQLLGDPAHKHVNPMLYRVDEVLACWRAIAAPVLWVEGADTDISKWWGHRYPREDFESRLAVVPRLQRERLAECGHMLHRDQPEVLARHLHRFLTQPD